MIKFKTYEYKVIRKIREKIKNFWQNSANSKENNKKPGEIRKLEDRYDEAYQKCGNEIETIMKGHELPQNKNVYLELMDLMFYEAKENQKLMQERFVDFAKKSCKDSKFSPKKFDSHILDKRPSIYTAPSNLS